MTESEKVKVLREVALKIQATEKTDGEFVLVHFTLINELKEALVKFAATSSPSVEPEKCPKCGADHGKETGFLIACDLAPSVEPRKWKLDDVVGYVHGGELWPGHICDMACPGGIAVYLKDLPEIQSALNASSAGERDYKILANHYLNEWWKDCRSDGKPAIREAAVIATAYFKAGVFSSEEMELWKLRLHTCPGHDDEGGRSWCAYCGSTPFAQATRPQTMKPQRER